MKRCKKLIPMSLLAFFMLISCSNNGGFTTTKNTETTPIAQGVEPTTVIETTVEPTVAPTTATGSVTPSTVTPTTVSPIKTETVSVSTTTVTPTIIPTTTLPVENVEAPNISLDNDELILKTNKSGSLRVIFPEDYAYDSDGGFWNTTDSSIAEVSQYGKVTGKKPGTAFVTYTTSNGDVSTKCAVYVVDSNSEARFSWNKVTDMDSIKNGDIIVFASPELKVSASLEKKSGYLLPSEATFSSDGNKITDLGFNTATFFVGATDTPNEFTLETTDGLYLAGRMTDRGNALSLVKSKGQINWIFETPEGYTKGFCVNADIQVDLWLMFNKINKDDIRFNLYDSNETKLMILPSIYRKEMIINK